MCPNIIFDYATSVRGASSTILAPFGLGRLIIASAFVLSLTTSQAAAGASGLEIGNKLADILRAGRSAVSANQPLINNPDIADKGFTGEKLIEETEAIYAERIGSPLLGDDLSPRDQRLIEAQINSMRKIVDDHQSDINRQGTGFKGFIPAVFARLVNEEFAASAGTEARVRVTAPPDLVRNRKARPDRWERTIIETKLLTPDWPKGKAYTEQVEYEGRPAFRMLLPEYYSASCLSCHGSPKEETDITGYPKEGGKEGDLGGVISIVIFE